MGVLRSKWGKRGLVLVVTLIALECFLRLIAGNMKFAPYAFYLEDGRCVGLEPNASVSYTGWLWRLEPVEHGSNEYGYRGAPRAPEKPDGVFRIAALGDSFVYGQGVSEDDAVSVQLERRLTERLPGVEVLNFGVPGFNMEEYLEQYSLFIKRWTPDLLLLFLFSNDMGAPLCAGRPSPSTDGQPVTSENSQTPFYLIRAMYMVVHVGMVIVSRVKDRQEQVEQSARFDTNLGELKRMAAQAGTKLALVVLEDPLATKGALRDITWLHGVPTLADEENRWQLERIPGETHYSVKGLNDLAGHVESWLVDEKLIPLPGAPSTAPPSAAPAAQPAP